MCAFQGKQCGSANCFSSPFLLLYFKMQLTPSQVHDIIGTHTRRKGWGMRWKDVSRMRQESANLENLGSFSQSRLKRQISEDSSDYNIYILNSFWKPLSLKEWWPISYEWTICFFPFSDRFFLHLVFCSTGGRQPKPNIAKSQPSFSLVIQNCSNLSQRVPKVWQSWVEK